MDLFLGTKLVKAESMTRAEYNTYRGWELPANEAGSDLGYLVEYMDGGQSNHPDHDGYISWSPKDVFSNAYQNVNDGMSFGHAIELLKLGYKVARKGWNGKGMYLYLVPENIYQTQTEVAKQEFGEIVACGAYIAMKPASGPVVIGWLASQTDMLCDDWILVE